MVGATGDEIRVRFKVPGHDLRKFTVGMPTFEILYKFVLNLIDIDNQPLLDLNLRKAASNFDFYGSNFLNFTLNYGHEIIQYARGTEEYHEIAYYPLLEYL